MGGEVHVSQSLTRLNQLTSYKDKERKSKNKSTPTAPEVSDGCRGRCSFLQLEDNKPYHSSNCCAAPPPVLRKGRTCLATPHTTLGVGFSVWSNRSKHAFLCKSNNRSTIKPRPPLRCHVRAVHTLTAAPSTYILPIIVLLY